MTRPVALFDLDGTLADNAHRQPLVTAGKKDWDAFFDAQIEDTPNAPIVTIYQALFVSDNIEIIIMTARPERYREVSETWLKMHEIPFRRIIMRADGDRRSDDVIKREMLADLRQEGINPIFAVDDRASVVRMWRDEGVTCLQCADHDF
jgi:phosphoglycolate phosphatase-like HAD superfamily hydrolase